MLLTFIKFLLIISVFMAENLLAESENSIEEDDFCSKLTGRPCNDQEEYIYQLWIDLNEKSYEIKTEEVEKIGNEILRICADSLPSDYICKLSFIEASLELNNHDSQIKSNKILSRLADKEMLMNSLDISIYLGIEYLRLLWTFTWEIELIEEFITQKDEFSNLLSLSEKISFNRQIEIMLLQTAFL